jgi:hypothetical protein
MSNIIKFKREEFLRVLFYLEPLLIMKMGLLQKIYRYKI